MKIAPIPYGAGISVTHPLQQFQEDWNNNYSSGTQSQDMNLSAIGGFTDGANIKTTNNNVSLTLLFEL